MLYIELISGIWIGDVDMLQKKKFFIDNEISIIMNCTQEFQFPDIEVEKIRLPFYSYDTIKNFELVKQNYQKVIDYIHVQSQTKNIFINCYNGLQISPFIVLLYLQKYSGIHKQSLFEIIKSKHSDFTLWFDLDLFD